MSYNENNTESTECNRRLQEFSTLHDEHRQEWLDSGVHSDLIELNVESITGIQAFERLYPTLDITARRNDGRLRDSWLRRYEAVTATSGWWVTGIDLTTGEVMKWGRYKPTEGQIIDPQKGKPAKYLSPAKTESRLILLQVSEEIWQRVSERCGIPIEKCDRDRGFWHWVWRCNVPIELCEGEKKAGSLLTQGYAAIALPGIYSGYRSPKDTNGQRCGERFLIPDLAHFDTPHRQVTICFDFESDPIKAKRVEQAAISTAYCFKKATPRIAYLPGPHKGVDDFLVAGGDFASVYRQAKKLSTIKADKAWQLTAPVNLELNQRYLGELPFPESGLAGVKSAKGTGKTTALQKVVSNAVGRGRKVLLLTHRIVLGQAICEAVGIPYISEVKATEQGRVAGFGLCIDSCHPQGQGQINPENWEGAIIIIDEVEQVLWHLLNSSTCRKTRVAILKTFKALIAKALSTGGLVIFQDADLSNYAVEFLQGCAGIPIQPWICVNNWKPEQGWKVTSYEGQAGKKDNAAALLDKAVQEIDDGGKIVITCDSQKAGSTYGTQNIESFIKRKCLEARVLRIDSVTVADPKHPAYNCAGKLNETVENYDVVITSPTLATGVSIDIKGHFTGVYGIFQGSISDNEVRQALARVRENVPRHVWVKERAVGMVGNGSDSYEQLISSRQKDVKLNCRLLKDADFDLDKSHDAIALRTWAKQGARINAGVWDFREQVKQGLLAEGHTIRTSEEESADTASEMKDIKEQAWDEEDQAVVAADDLTDEQHEKLQEKRSRTEDERLMERKYNLKKSYNIDVVPELHKLDQKGLRPQALMHYYLTHDLKFLEMRDRKHLAGHIERGEGEVCAQDVRLLMLQVQMLKRMGVLEMAESGKPWSKNSPELKEMLRGILPHAKDIKDILGITISPQMVEEDPIRAFQNLLGKIGLRLKGRQERNEAGEQERVYQGIEYKSKLERQLAEKSRLEGESALREQIFAAWLERDQQALEFKSVDQPVRSANFVSEFDTNLSHQNLIREKQTTVTNEVDKPEEAPFKQGALVRWAGKAAQFCVSWCGIGIAAVRDVVSGQAFNAPTDELILA